MIETIKETALFNSMKRKK